MSRNPAVSFGMVATAVSFSAKAGSLQLRQRLELARAALRFVDALPGVCDEVEFFLATVDGDPIAAANRLAEYVDVLVPSPMPQQPAFDWMARADCGHG